MPRRVMQGKVVQDKADKTISVLVERMERHPIYKKYIKKSRKIQAHDEKNEFKVGDEVSIKECAPISKNKAFYALSNKDAQTA